MPTIDNLQSKIRKTIDIKQLTQEISGILTRFETGMFIKVDGKEVPYIDVLSEHFELLNSLKFVGSVMGNGYVKGRQFAHYLNQNAKDTYEQLKMEGHYSKEIISEPAE